MLKDTHGKNMKSQVLDSDCILKKRQFAKSMGPIPGVTFPKVLVKIFFGHGGSF